MRKKLTWGGKYALVALGALIVGATVVFTSYAYPTLAAATCPTCYGLERIAPGLLIDDDMPVAMQEQLKTDVLYAETIVIDFFGAFPRHPIIIACSSEQCDNRFGGRGARATAYSTPFGTVIRLSPRGLNALIITHEFAHAEVHRRVGIWKLMTSALPAWFDEGIAVIVSNDGRYLNQNASGRERCVRDTGNQLPASAYQWALLSGKDPLLYADAACRALQWMNTHGGKDGLQQMIDAIASGQAFRP